MANTSANITDELNKLQRSNSNENQNIENVNVNEVKLKKPTTNLGRLNFYIFFYTKLTFMFYKI